MSHSQRRWRTALLLPELISQVWAVKTFLNWSTSRANQVKTNNLNRRNQFWQLIAQRTCPTQKLSSTALMWASKSNRKSSRCTKRELTRRWGSERRSRALGAAHQIFNTWTSTGIRSQDSGASEVSSWSKPLSLTKKRCSTLPHMRLN